MGGKPVTKYDDALFFVGSNTKVFTGIMLALAVLSKKVALDTPIADLLPSGLKIQQPYGSILLKHLATHSSGYPDGPLRLSIHRLPVRRPDRFSADFHSALRARQILAI